MIISRCQAASELLDEAYNCLRENKLAAAITLAGAAEASLPPPEDALKSVFDGVKNLAIKHHKMPEKGIVASLNRIRDWLKHNKPGDMEIQEADAFVMLLRAYVKFEGVFGDAVTTKAMKSFEKEWIRGRYEHWIQPRRNNPTQEVA